MIPIIIALIVGFLLLYWYLVKNNNYWQKLGINGPKPLPFFGNFIDRLLQPMGTLDVEYIKKYGPIVGLYEGRDSNLLVADPQLIKQILVKDFHKFSDRRELKTWHPIINRNLFNTAGNDWRRQRNIMSPTFTSGKIKHMYHTVRQCLQEYIVHLDRMAANSNTGSTGGAPVDIDIKSLHQNFTLDVIATCAFATKTNSQSQPDNPFIVNAKNVFTFPIPKIIAGLVFPPWLNRLLGVRTIINEAPNEYIFEATRHILKSRRRQEGGSGSDKTKQNRDFLQLLIDAKADDNHNNNNNNNIDNKTINNDINDTESHHITYGEDEIQAENRLAMTTVITDKSLNETEIIAQSWLFLLAGFETTATTLGYLSYLLALHPAVQTKLYEELRDSIGTDGEFGYERLQSLPYLDAVVSETLRLYPPLQRLERLAIEDVQLGGPTGPKILAKQLVEIPVYAIHHSGDYYKQPEEFIPERFLPENRQSIVPYSYLPFGTGPRNCLGMRFALMEVKLAIAHIVHRYRLVRTAQTEPTIQFKKANVLLTAESITVGIEMR